MPLAINHNVFRLEVSVDNQVFVKMFNCAENFGKVKSHVVLHPAFVCSDAIQQVASSDKFHLNVDTLAVVKSCIRSHDEMVPVAGLTQVV